MVFYFIKFSQSSHRDLHRSYSNSPTINNRIHNSLQVPSSSVHSASSTDSIDCFENNPADNIPVLDNNIDPFSSTAKQIKTDYYRSKAQELIGSENFSRIYNYLHEQHKEQSEDPTRTDNIILSGLQALSTNSHACTLINELVLHECLNELNERTETS
ncbi:unnamed protein product [Rotaria sordida]|uniref:Uncharacterized protein n=1 Tax=Rotaria sordida TaxID=392033 RepID=A0A818J796_9BILA|nr:unnamed protein product [Rotaria sordida]CAF3534662.1 unnamed protein product [Rotaria sordida]